ncbi:MAG: tRNA (N6-isopentenyl adenosine(37)-C2)-methylthiotransferase MiaB [Acidimicrobiales bacterium]|nr:MAG: tRNA (N6-isopentenyl adenosine(37)-C2)-methylthiotransferase MiaB [Acidimicrobiales bacterium]
MAQSQQKQDKSVFIRTYGCQMNVYDSERMADLLRPHGYRAVEAAENADLIILNTCHIREKAAEKVYSELGRLKQLKEAGNAAGRNVKIVVAGCVAQAEGAEIKSRAPQVDMVFGPQSYHHLPEYLARSSRLLDEAVETEFDVEEKFDSLDNAIAPRTVTGPAAYVTIQEGCDKFCTFCVVPYTRGAEVSRTADEIVNEVRLLSQQGVREITLLGQNVNAWMGPAPRGEAWKLGDLCRHLALIDGIDRIRFTTSHPRDMDQGLIDAFADEKKLMPYLHLPVQSGSDKVLKAMNRGHTAAEYLDIINAVRKARPDIAISGDFIVGFPDESDADFEQTLKLVEEIEYASAYSFKYSRRPGTPGAGMPKQVAETEKDSRLARLQAVLEAQKTRFNQSQIGRTLPILFEKTGRHDGQLIGRTPYLQSVHAKAPESMIGSIELVYIKDATPNALSGVLQKDSEAVA